MRYTIADKTATLYMYGGIGRWDDINSREVTNILHEAGTAKANRLVLRLNSPGGEVSEGFAIFNLLKNSGLPITIYVDGIAASMGSYLLLVSDDVRVAKNAKLMVHAVSGSAYGNSAKLRETADMMDDWQLSIQDEFVERTGLPENTVAKWFAAGKDTWINASKAVELKIAREIYQPATPAKATASKDPQAAYQYYAIALGAENNAQEDKEDMDTSEAKTTADTGANGVKAVESNVDTGALRAELEQTRKEKAHLEQQIADNERKLKEERAAQLVDAALAEGKVTAAEKEELIKDAVENYALVAKMLSKIVRYESPTSQIAKAAGEETKKPSLGGVAARMAAIQSRSEKR